MPESAEKNYLLRQLKKQVSVIQAQEMVQIAHLVFVTRSPSSTLAVLASTALGGQV